MLNTKFIILYTKSIILYTKSIVLYTKSHLVSALRRDRQWCHAVFIEPLGDLRACLEKHLRSLFDSQNKSAFKGRSAFFNGRSAFFH